MEGSANSNFQALLFAAMRDDSHAVVTLKGSHLAIALLIIFGIASAIIRGRAAKERQTARLWAVQQTMFEMSKPKKT